MSDGVNPIEVIKQQENRPMLGWKMSRVAEQLKRVFGAKRLQTEARRSRFERRAPRVIEAVDFVSSLLHSLGTRRVESLADLHRDFNADHGIHVNYKPYYERLDTAGFVELMRALFETLMNELCMQALKPSTDSPLKVFEDVVIQDGTSFALHDDLRRIFPGRFKTVSPAAVELHTTMSLFHDNMTSVTITPDSECERHHLPEPHSLAGKLLLIDRGYDGRPYLNEVAQNGGHFVVRIRGTLDPVVTRIHRTAPRFRKLEGERLSAVIHALPKGKTTDMDIAWFKSDGSVLYAFRLIARYHSTDAGWTRLMTSLPRSSFTPHVVLQAYRLRWQVELYYKELKSYANLHAFSTRKRHIAEGLFWASLSVAFLKRYFAYACQQTCRTAPISTRRVAMCSHTFLRSFFDSVCDRMKRIKIVLAHAFRFLERNALRSNPLRERKRGRLALDFVPVGIHP